MAERKRVAILISGRGSNMAALIAAAAERDFPAEIVAVISDKADAPGLAVASGKGIATKVVQRRDFPSREAHDGAIDAALKAFRTDIVCLAGYMRLFTTVFVEAWLGRMINIHPALLPLFKGLDTHKRAIEAGMRVAGCTVHFVTPKMDDGPIIAQAAVPVRIGDTEAELTARVLKAEHQLYPMALRLLAEGKVRIDDSGTVFDRVTDGASGLIAAPDPEPDVTDIQELARFTP